MDNTSSSRDTKIAKPLLPRRERNRPDWPILVYSYDVTEFIGDRPKWVNATDKAMRYCWNEMVAELRKKVDPIINVGQDVQTDYTALRAVEKEFKQTKYIREIAARYSATLSVQCREEVVSRFLKAMRMIGDVKKRRKEEGKKVYPDTGYPKFKSYTQWEMNIPFIFNEVSGQEWEFCDLYENNSRCSLWRVPEASNAGHNIAFVIRKPQSIEGAYTPIKLVAAIHRLPPMNAVVKKVAIIEQKNPPLQSTYKVQFSLEIPPNTLPNKVKSGRVAGFDIGWRRFGGDIRIAVITDNAGHSYELSIPRDFSNRATRRERKHVGDLYNKITSWDDLWASQAQQDEWLEQKKAEVRSVFAVESDWPASVAGSYSNKAIYDRLRASGLKKTLRALREECPESKAVPILEEWIAMDTEYRRRHIGFWLRFRRWKQDVYSKIASWLAVSFDAVAYEGDFDLSEIAEGSKDEKILKRARKNRQMVGISSLRNRVKQTADRVGMEWMPVPKAGTTSTCSVCGEKVNKTGKHILTCVNGHEIDRDRNASTNLRNRMEHESHTSITAAPLAIPADLRRYLRVLPATEENRVDN